MQRLLSCGLTAVLFTIGTLSAQTCGASETLLINDILGPNPSGSTQVSVIQGLCEGEAAGCVFDVSSMGSSVAVKKAAVGLFAGGGAQGNQIQANLRIFDGISWSGGIPTLGPKVFDFTSATGAGIGLTSSAINEVDLSGFNIVITSGTLVVTWWSDLNLNGSCALGFTTNFATDNTCPFNCPCTGGSQQNLIFIQTQGWRDAATATVQGFPICGGLFNAYNGNWIIRACVEAQGCTAPIDLGPGTQGSSGITPILQGSGGDSQIGNASFGLTVAAARGGAFSAILFGPELSFPFAGGTVYVNPILSFGLPLGGPAGVPGAGFATLPIPIPNDPALIGGILPAQVIVVDPGGTAGFALTNGIRVVIC